MFFEILGSLEGLATEIALVRLQGNMDADVRSDVVTLYSCGATGPPGAGQVQVIRALAAYMAFAYMVLCYGSVGALTLSVASSRVGRFGTTHIELLWRGRALSTATPLALQKLILCYLLRGVLRLGGGRSRERLLLFRCRHLRALGVCLGHTSGDWAAVLALEKATGRKGTERCSRTTTMQRGCDAEGRQDCVSGEGAGWLAGGVLRRG